MKINKLIICLTACMLLSSSTLHANPYIKIGRAALKFFSRAKTAHEAYKIVSSFVSSDQSTIQGQKLRRAIYYIEQSSLAEGDLKVDYLSKSNIILDKLWIDGRLDNEIRANVAFLKAAIARQNQELKQAISWWNKVLNSPFDKGIFSSKPKENKNIIQLKQMAAGSICQSLDTQDKRLGYYCGLSYFLSQHASDPYLYYIDQCIRNQNRTLCGKLGVKLISDVIKQTSSTHERLIQVDEKNKVFIEIALNQFLPNFKRSDLKTATADDIIQLYWMAVGFEGGYGRYDLSSKIYADLCMQPFKGDRYANDKIARSCKVLTNREHWSHFDNMQQANLAFEGCLNKGFTGGCLKLFHEEGIKKINKHFRRINQSMSERIINNNDQNAFLMYHMMNQYHTDRRLLLKEVSITSTNDQGDKWDLFGSPDPLVEIRTESGVLLLKTKLAIKSEGRHEIILDLGNGVKSLPFSRQDSNLTIWVYDMDNTELETIGHIQFSGEQNGRKNLYKGSIKSLTIEIEDISRDQHPYTQILQALNERAQSK